MNVICECVTYVLLKSAVLCIMHVYEQFNDNYFLMTI